MVDVEAQDVVVEARGAVQSSDLAYAQRKVGAVLGRAPGPVLFAKVELVAHDDPARERPCFAKAELDLDGRMVRAHASGTTPMEAVDRLEDRLRARLERSVHHPEATHLRHRGDAHWRHGDEPTPRHDYYPRPLEERELLRRKTFAVAPLSDAEAALELEQLDHDFYLFTNAESGVDNLISRVGDGRYELMQPASAVVDPDGAAGISPSPVHPAPMSLDDAIDLLDDADQPFVFFLDPDRGRGRVAYRRYDGHYGLITPADDVA